MGEGCRGPEEPCGFHVDQATQFCYICGQPIMQWQVAAMIHGDYADFMNKTIGNICITICSECWQDINNNLDKTLEDVIKKYKEDHKYGD